VFDIGERRQAEGDEALHQIGAALGGLGDDLADRVDDVGVVAEAADHGILATLPVEQVVAGIAGQPVGEAIADAGEIARAGENQILDAGAEREADGTVDRVDAGASGLVHEIAGVIDPIGVVTGAAAHGVGAAAAVEDVGGGVADEEVV